MYQRTVLVVDDEPLIRMALADCLADEGYAVLEARMSWRLLQSWVGIGSMR